MILDVTCSDLSFILKIVAKLLKYLHYLIPALLILFVVIDIAKVIVGQADDKAKTEAFNKAVKRVIYAVIIFLVPTILFFILDKINNFNSSKDGNVSATTGYECFMAEYKNS